LVRNVGGASEWQYSRYMSYNTKIQQKEKKGRKGEDEDRGGGGKRGNKRGVDKSTIK